MRRSIPIVIALALVVAACGSDSGSVAATVNGSEIDVDDVRGLFFDTSVEPNAAEFASYLGLLVQWTLVEQKAQADFEITPTTEEVDAGVQQLLTDAGHTGTLEEFLEAQNVSEDALRRYSAQVLIEERVQEEMATTVEEPTDEAAQQAIDDDPTSWTEVCASHLLVATEAEAQEAMDRITSGEAFADVATEVSTDTASGSNGGSLGCTSSSDYVPEFADATMTAPIGEIVGPVQTEFGYHLILVDSRTTSTLDEVKQGLHQTAVQDALNTWFSDALAAATIEVTPEYGTWVMEPTPQVLPPG